MLLKVISCALALTSFTSGQFPPPREDFATQHLSAYPGVSIDYKQTTICEHQARGWSGYVHMPASYLKDIESSEPYDVSMFFWYFEARNNPLDAPTGIYLAGGPGEASTVGAVSDGGPCTVRPDSNDTIENPWSWNTNVNMLYIDQPVSTGFSYTKLVNSTVDLLFLGSPTETGIVPFEDWNGSVPPRNTTFLYGTFSEQNPQKTVNSTLSAAKTLWLFSQAWFSGFPEYRTRNERVSIWGNSYGGYWVPVTAAYIKQQNARISAGSISGTIIPVDTVGWTNGCTDELYQGEWYPDMAYNNTYNVSWIPKPVYEEAKRNFTKTGGCRDQILECRSLGALYDPDQLNINSTISKVCADAELYCFSYVIGAYDALTYRSDFDMAHLKPDPFPPSYPNGFFNQEWVQKDLGVGTNWTDTSALVNNLFYFATGDAVRTAGLKDVEYLLDHGVKVALMYGDRDYRCPWIGAEQLSLAAKWAGAEEFKTAGYEYVHTNESYLGGVVREHGDLSFTRVFQAGHDAQLYQPETIFQLLNRAIFDKDLATGKVQTDGTYSTHGPLSSFGITDELPKPPFWNCNIWSVGGTCTQEQFNALEKGTAEILDYRVVKPAGGSPGSLGSVL